MNFHLRDGSEVEFTAYGGRNNDIEGALTLLTLHDTYRSFACSEQKLTSQIRSRIKYLIPSGNVIVLDRHFKLIKKSNLIDDYVVAYFLGHDVK